jgi:NADH-quinone oxidoreductase subunit M
MILAWLIVILLLGGVAAWIASRWSAAACRWSALLTTIAAFAVAIGLWLRYPSAPLTPSGAWMLELNHPWFTAPQFNFVIQFHLALDGLSLLMLLLTGFLGIVAVLVSWNEITERVGFFHMNLLFVLAGVTGVFLAMDLFLFYFFWELMLIPMYYLIDIWGHERRHYAAIKFFIFTQLSGLLMLVAIITLALLSAPEGFDRPLTFDYGRLIFVRASMQLPPWIMLGFFVAFAVKLPAFPFHPWLPDAHTEAPTAGSVILAGLLLKTGAYGLIRFAIPLFPEASRLFAPIAMTLGVIGIIYGAVLAFAQTDFKRLVAYTSVSHLGFVLLGIYAWNTLALQGAVMEMLCHGFSTGALFVIAGLLQERLGTRDMRKMGGLWTAMPGLGGVALVFALASLGLPGLGNFIAEFLILLGSFRAAPVLTVIASVGMLFAMIYSLWLVYRTFFGPRADDRPLPDLHPREALMLGAMLVALLWLGLYPQPVLRTASSALTAMQAFSGRISAIAMTPLPAPGRGEGERFTAPTAQGGQR